MAEPKTCPVCRLVHPPEAVRCECGYDFPAQRARAGPAGHREVVPISDCQLCGAEAETKHVSFHQNIGLLVLRLHSSVDGWLCKPCIHKQFWEKTGITFLLGWWGVLSFIITPFILLNNIVRYLFCLRMTSPPGHSH